MPTASPTPSPSARERICTIGDYIVYYGEGRYAELEAYLWPMLVVTKVERRMLPVIVTCYQSQHVTKDNLVMAATVMIVILILIVYLFFQRWVVRGIALTGFK